MAMSVLGQPMERWIGSTLGSRLGTPGDWGKEQHEMLASFNESNLWSNLPLIGDREDDPYTSSP
jgi:hypothetical protein